MSKSKSQRARKRAAIALTISAFIGGVLAFGAMMYITMSETANNMPHSPDYPDAVEDDGFPKVDWDYWKGVNENVVGWITIPGTGIDHPIMQATAEDPNYWLTHDVYGNWNIYGALYVDAECPGGLSAKNAVILGHHMIDESMLSVAAGYVDKEFMEEHKLVFLQTPEWKQAFNIGAAEIIGGWQNVKRATFESEEDFSEYLKNRIENCNTVLRNPFENDYQPKRMLTLCTCSYNFYPDDERTLAYGWC